MNIEFLTRRQAVTEWRDRQLFQAMSMLNTAGIDARAALDQEIKDAAGDPQKPVAFGRL